MTDVALYVIIHVSDESPTVETITVEQLWTDPRLAAGDERDMLSAVRALDRRGVARDAASPTILVLGSAAEFRRQLAAWYWDTPLPPAARDSVQALLGWQHPLGDDPDNAGLRALWTYLVEAGGVEIVAGMAPGDFARWVAFGGYPRGLTPLDAQDPVPEDNDVNVVCDILTDRCFVLG
ncbi:MAG: hypothetical protein C7B45_03550 [Sulfobacillus acidophilus]|uniref:Uncharacterized protein n=1 Tax=Sulfobacillus acidophilus TaxID=53633 RepID=A0A2T2WMD7_9FIRM|nr:MAG: hypothetical protein C7B45_03550 [Sulfobacillus acidophilus]